MITIADVQDSLQKDDLTFTDEVVGQVLAAEHAHQRSVLNIPSPRPAKVDEALMARVLHNLRTTSGEPVQRIGYQGDGVSKLEAPYRVRTTQTTGTTRRRKKRPATTAANPKKES